MPLSTGVSSRITHTVINPELEPVYVNDATVTVTIVDSAGDELPDETWPVELPYVTGSNGEYSKIFNPFSSLVVGEIYTVKIKVVGLDSLEDNCETKIRATNRKC